MSANPMTPPDPRDVAASPGVTECFTQYHRRQIAELRPYVPGEDVAGVSISPADRENGSPCLGDMIARNPKNHADQWLVAKQYFDDNFAPIAAPSPSPEGMALETTAAERVNWAASIKMASRGRLSDDALMMLPETTGRVLRDIDRLLSEVGRLKQNAEDYDRDATDMRYQRDAASARAEALASDLAKAQEAAHYANGVADLAIQHRDAAEAALAKAQREHLVRAAIWHDGAVYSVARPGRHGDVIMAMAERPHHSAAHTHEQGFLTSEGRYVDREVGWLIAKAAGQLIGEHVGPKGMLFSEDLW